ncbi:efflux RND transporter periplasmic adaptor subunit [uncultured Sphaerotilus sp.]|uniref:efflux RND transporter periplasmic adaptor subunit n=1 Tax=uncultured Sphaerotilus sp. TaxID=474984 RepID=UPI0030CA5600
MKTRTIATLLIVAGAAGGTYWWLKKSPAADAASAPMAAGSAAGGASAPAGGTRGGPQTVGIALAQQRDVPVSIEAAGSVVALDSVEIRPQTTGVITEVAVTEGQAIQRGAVLFKLDDRADRANLDKAKAQLAKDKATQADLERQLARAKELFEQNFIARNAVDTLQTQLDAQLAAVRASVAGVQSIEVALSNNVLKAPRSGRAGAVNVVKGSLVQPGGAALVTLTQLDPIGVSFTLPEAQLGLLRKADKELAKDGGVPLTVQLPGERRGQPAAALPGNVSFIDSGVDATTGTIRVKGKLVNEGRQFWPGQYVTVKLTLRTIQDAIVIPQAAVIVRGNERSVYVVDAEGNAQMKPVQLRQPLGEQVVVEGVAAGEKIVVEGKQNLRPGSPVREAATGGGKGASAAGPASGASR